MVTAIRNADNKNNDFGSFLIIDFSYLALTSCEA